MSKSNQSLSLPNLFLKFRTDVATFYGRREAKYIEALHKAGYSYSQIAKLITKAGNRQTAYSILKKYSEEAKWEP